MGMVGVWEPPSSSMVTPKPLAAMPWEFGHDDAGVALVVGVEGAGGDGRAAVCGDDPELVGLVGLERIEVAGEEDERAFRGL